MSKITFKKLNADNIDLLNLDNTIYTNDFRAISENMNYKIPAMFKYENLLPWIVDSNNKNTYVVVNEDAKTINYIHSSRDSFVVAEKDNEDARVSVYDRIGQYLPKHIKNLWVGIPHPDADRFARINSLDINYSFQSFLEKNNKIKQKELMQKHTPEWKVVNKKDEIVNTKNKYLKRTIGSGGYTVFKTEELGNEFYQLFDDDEESLWYEEEEIVGDFYSVQCVRQESGTVTVFGSGKQIIEDGKYYSGSNLYDVMYLPGIDKEFIQIAIQNLQPLLDNYVGFFGIDYVKNKESIYFLEANIRMTSVTVPALLFNKSNYKEAVFKEDIQTIKLNDYENLLTLDPDSGCVDIIEFKQNQGDLGLTVLIRLDCCSNLPPSIKKSEIEPIELIVSKNVSTVVEASYYNFWPHGWTLNFILADSHCSISSWYIEKTVLIDVFCCSDFNPDNLKKELGVFFGMGQGKIEVRHKR